MGPQGPERLWHRRAESCCMGNVRRCYSPSSLKKIINQTTAQKGSKMTLLVLLCTSKLHLLNSELIVFFSPAGSFVCVQLWGKAGERLASINAGAEWRGRLKQLLRLLWRTGTAALLFGNTVHRSTPAIILTAGHRCKTNKHTNSQAPRLRGRTWQPPTLRVSARSFSLSGFQPFSAHTRSLRLPGASLCRRLSLSLALRFVYRSLFSFPPPPSTGRSAKPLGPTVLSAMASVTSSARAERWGGGGNPSLH